MLEVRGCEEAGSGHWQKQKNNQKKQQTVQQRVAKPESFASNGGTEPVCSPPWHPRDDFFRTPLKITSKHFKQNQGLKPVQLN